MFAILNQVGFIPELMQKYLSYQSVSESPKSFKPEPNKPSPQESLELQLRQQNQLALSSLAKILSQHHPGFRLG